MRYLNEHWSYIDRSQERRKAMNSHEMSNLTNFLQEMSVDCENLSTKLERGFSKSKNPSIVEQARNMRDALRLLADQLQRDIIA